MVTSPDSVDLGNPKVVRASVGSLFHLPVVPNLDIAEAITTARAAGMQVFAADGSGEVLGPQLDLAHPTMWVFGNEAWGLPENVLTQCDRVVSLPIYGKAESLNLAISAGGLEPTMLSVASGISLSMRSTLSKACGTSKCLAAVVAVSMRVVQTAARS